MHHSAKAKSKQAGKTDYKVSCIEQSSGDEIIRRHGRQRQAKAKDLASKSVTPAGFKAGAAQAEDAGSAGFSCPLSARRPSCDQPFQPLDDRALVRA